MKFHHICNENGKEDTHWYVDLQVGNRITIKNMLVDTGASITTLNIKSIARIYGQGESEIRNYIIGSDITDKLTKYTATNDIIKLYGVYIRNIQIGDTQLPILKVYTRVDGYVSNLIGMDILSNCKVELLHKVMGIADMDTSLYCPMIDGAGEIKKLR